MTKHGFYFDVIRHDTERVPLKIYSTEGLVPLFAATVPEPSTLVKLPIVMQTVGNLLNRRGFLSRSCPRSSSPEKTARGSSPSSAGLSWPRSCSRCSTRHSSCRSAGWERGPANTLSSPVQEWKVA